MPVLTDDADSALPTDDVAGGAHGTGLTACWTMRSPSLGAVEEPHSAHFRRALSGRDPQGNLPSEGLRMSQQDFRHDPVMRDEVVDLFAGVPRGVVVDATVGGGGHARAILESRPDLRLLGIDRDPDALAASARVLGEFHDRVTLRRARFDQLASVATAAAAEPVSAVLFDLGVSSPQFDRIERGFSYRGDADLDMRMDPDEPLTAATVLNTYAEQELTRLFRESGERFARSIARRIVADRPLHTTSELVDVVRTAVPARARRTGGHPARKVFQALRIEVNRELEVLPVALTTAIDLVAPLGRVVVLSYHSGEDRIVKDVFTDAATGGCVCPPRLPCVCGATPKVRLLWRSARKPTAEEVLRNPRAESARLRAAERLVSEDADEVRGSAS